MIAQCWERSGQRWVRGMRGGNAESVAVFPSIHEFTTNTICWRTYYGDKIVNLVMNRDTG